MTIDERGTRRPFAPLDGPEGRVPNATRAARRAKAHALMKERYPHLDGARPLHVRVVSSDGPDLEPPPASFGGKPFKVLSVFGTRPEAIKMAPVVKKLENHPHRIVSRVCVTAQHRGMLDQVLNLFEIVPDYDLDVMRTSQSPTQVAAAVMAGLEPVLRVEQPDWVLVQGDTTTVTAASLAAFYAGSKVGHVEAGLRSFDKWAPFPEETNRRVAAAIADLHFVPTEAARANLLREGVASEQILVTGNTVIDALLRAADMRYDFDSGPLEVLDPSLPTILVTSHRRENLGQPQENLCRALLDLATRYKGRVQIVWPVHPNPAVQATVKTWLSDAQGIHLLAPLDYLPMVHLMRRSTLVLTDSGGLQEEAPAFGRPVLVLRETTERPEAVDAGTSRLIGTGRERIVEEVSRLLDDQDAYRAMAHAVNPYGDGQAAGRVVQALLLTAAGVPGLVRAGEPLLSTGSG